MTQAAAHPQFVKVWADGGYFMRARKVTGVYWSVRVHDPRRTGPDVMIRKQDMTYTTNNDAEWLAVREALQYVARECADCAVVIYSDSMYVVKQFSGEYKARIARHHRFRDECRTLAQKVKFVVLEWVPRAVSVDKLGH